MEQEGITEIAEWKSYERDLCDLLGRKNEKESYKIGRIGRQREREMEGERDGEEGRGREREGERGGERERERERKMFLTVAILDLCGMSVA